MLEVFVEVAEEDDAAVNAATVLLCRTGPFVIVSSPFEDVVNL